MVVEPDSRLTVKVEDANLGRIVEAKVDMVMLETGLVPQLDADKMGTIVSATCMED